MNTIASPENTVTAKMKAVGVVAATPAVTPANVYSAPSTYVKAGAAPALDQKIICYDCETTGTNPWDYRFLVVSFWDLSKPINTIETFASFDEEELTHQVAEYLNREKPYALIQYNNGFDERCLLTRFMLYQVAVPGWNDIKQIDVMDILKKGTTQSIASSQAVGSEEQWLQYFFGESKPYTIEECFEGVQNMDLTRFIIRNRTCVGSEGSLYLLFRSATDATPLQGVEEKPTIVNRTEAAKEGKVLVVCPTCAADNVVAIGSKNNTCYRCLGSIPDPNSENILKEVLREFDFTKVGTK